MIETLLRTEKRNPVLLGPAGVGKTAIVEGLAQRIVAGSVPALLRSVRLVEVPLGSLVAGTQYRGQLEDRLLQLIAEASRPEIVLFFDEIQLLEGTGQSEGGIGAAELLKPALARGDVAVIGATTADAWRDTIAKDDALARRFSTLAISELDRAATRPILRSVADGLEKREAFTSRTRRSTYCSTSPTDRSPTGAFPKRASTCCSRRWPRHLWTTGRRWTLPTRTPRP